MMRRDPSRLTRRQKSLIMPNRRTLIKGAAASAAIVSSLSFTRIASAQTGVIRIGYVTPRTGELALFGEADEFVINGINQVFADGIEINGTNYGVQVIVADSQSSPSRAADVAAQLILQNDVHLMLVGGTPETTNPVSDQCESNGVPCISSLAPWQPWFLGRGGTPDFPFDYTYHFFWGLEDVISVFTEMWSALDTNMVVGGMFPNDADGNAWGDPELGFPPVLNEMGFSLIDPGRYTNLSDDFTAQINAFRNGGAEIITGVMIPPDLITFWNQARQQGLNPKAASVGKALLFPAIPEALGQAGHNLSTEVWWTPSHPFNSSLTGASAAEVATAYTDTTGRQWTQPIGFAHALFEVAADVLSRSNDPTDHESIRDAIPETQMDTLVGPVDWASGTGPVPNVSKTPLVGGQWRLGGDFQYDLTITANANAPEIETTGEMEEIPS